MNEPASSLRGPDVAVIGLACRFAQAPDADAFWHNLLEARECFDEVPPGRWHNDVFYSEHARELDRSYVQRGAFIDELDAFAAMHFGIAPRRVQHMDPQHRLVLDAVRVALQDAGLETRRETLAPERTGTFLGVSSSEYRDLIAARTLAIEMAAGGFGQRPDPHGARAILQAVERVAPISSFSMPGSLLNMSAANIAHQWGLRGPAFTIDAACASALVAVYDAVLYIRAGICDSALAGGVYLNLNPNNLISFSRIGAISRQGRCRPFDAAADGFLQGDGCGVVVLKRLDHALRDGDRIRAVIRGVGINNDGDGSSGPMAPSREGQLEAIRLAHRDAGLDPATIGFVECHGTATAVGDPVEVAALREALDLDAASGRSVHLSSVKANIGHTMSAAGIAGMIKAILVLEHGVVPPQAAFDTPNPALELDGFTIAREPTAWPAPDDQPRRAAVSSFGFGGTNCHVVLEQAPAPPPRTPDARHELVVLDAPDLTLLAGHARAIAAALRRRPETPLADIAWTLGATRAREPARLCLVVRSTAALLEALDAAADKLGALEPGTLQGRIGLSGFFGVVERKAPAPELVFMFPGQGAQRVGLLRELYERQPGFAHRLDALCAASGLPLLGFLYPEAVDDPDAAEAALRATEICQPVMAALGLALAGWLGELGVRPTVTLGHSLGEFAAAAAGGILDPDDAVRFVARRGALMAGLEVEDRGAMAAVMAERAEVEPVIAGIDGVVVANVNHARQTVVSGTTPAVERALEAFEAAGISAKRLRVSHAFHSPVVAPASAGIAALVDGLALRAPDEGVTVVSAITGAAYPAEAAATREVFVRHATAPVDFVAALSAACPAGPQAARRIFLEVGAGKTLTSFCKGLLPEGCEAIKLASEQPDEALELCRALGQLVRSGVAVDLRALHAGQGRRVVSLPATPLLTERYWIVQDRPVPLKPAPALEVAPAAAPTPSTETSPVSSNPSDRAPSPELVALFREQAAVLRQHASILEQQVAVLGGGAAAAVAAGAGLAAPTAVSASAVAAGAGLQGLAAQTAVPVPGAALAAPPAATPAPSAATSAAPVASVAAAAAAPVASVVSVAAAGPLPAPGAPAVQPQPVAATAPRDEIQSRVLGAVAAVSAFPLASLELQQTLARDLGFDSLMFVELGTRIEEAFPGFTGGIPRALLSEATTIADLVAHMSSELGASAVSAAPAAGSAVTAAEPMPAPAARTVAAPRPPVRPMGLDRIDRYAPRLVTRSRSVLPGPRPAPGRRVLVTLDAGGVGLELARALVEAGSEVVLVEAASAPGALAPAAALPGARSIAWPLTAHHDDAIPGLFAALSEAGFVADAVVHAAALDAAAPLEALLAEPDAALRPVLVAQQLAAQLQGSAGGEPGAAFVVLTGMGGGLGLAPVERAPGAAAQYALVGFARALALEWTRSQVRVLDLDPREPVAQRAEAVLAELRGPHTEVAVGLGGGAQGVRRVVELAALPRRVQPWSPGEPVLDERSVVLVTGGSRGLGARAAVALAQRYRCSFVLVGRASLARAEEARQAMAAIQHQGGRAAYVQWDVAQAAPPALAEAVERLGPITAVVHAAGLLRDRRVASKTPEDVRAVLGAKASGLLRVLAAVEPERLRLVIGFGSWSGFFGNVGQTDYAAGNALLDGVLGELDGSRPGLRAVSIAWPPWDNSDMARTIPGPVRRAMEHEGVLFLADEDGLAALQREVDGGRGAVLIGEHVPVARERLRAELRLSVESHPYLADHALAGAPVLPLASALDYAALAALEAQGGQRPLVLERMTLYAGVEVREPVRLELELQRTRWENGRVADARVELRAAPAHSAADAGPGKLAYRVELGAPGRGAGQGIEPAPESVAVARRGAALPLGLEQFYAEHTFHGPLLRGIVAIDELGPQHVIGRVRASQPAELVAAPRRAAWTVDPLVVDSAFQLVAYWLWVERGQVCFPTGFKRFVQHAPFVGEVRCVVVQRSGGGADGAPFVGSIRFEDARGRVLGELYEVEATALRAASAPAPKNGAAPREDAAVNNPRPQRLREDAAAIDAANGAAPRPQRLREDADLIDPPRPQRLREDADLIDAAVVNAVGTNIPAEHWDVASFPEVQALRQRLEMAQLIGLRNPFFPMHHGIARDTSVVEGREMINFSSYNYLGFSGDPEVAAAAKAAIDRYGTSVSASRVASGERPLHRELEGKLASLLGVEDAVLFSAGHMTNESVIGHLFGDGDLIVHDALAHNSVMQGAIMSGAKRRPFPHDDVAALDGVLTKLRPQFKKCVIVTEGVYSMDGDIPDLPGLIALKQKHRCLLFVDEAHSIGVLGPRGGGVGEHHGIDPTQVDFWMGTLSKSFSSCGGYIAGRRELVEYLKYTAPGFVFSAGISPANTAAALASLDKMLREPERVATLQRNARRFVELLQARGVDTGLSRDSAVVPCIVGNSFKCLQLSQALGERGINVQPIVYPAVDDDAARLRFFISALHTEAQLVHTAEVLAEELAKLEIAPRAPQGPAPVA